jgi:hypothetical protein
LHGQKAINTFSPSSCYAAAPWAGCPISGKHSRKTYGHRYRSTGRCCSQNFNPGEECQDARFSRYLTGYANYSWQARPESKDLDVNSALNLPPAHRFNAGLNINYKRYLGSVSVSHVSSAYWNDVISLQYSGPTDAYTTVNFTGGLRWGSEGRYIIMGKVSNLANTPIQNHIFGDILKRQITGEFKVRF